MAKPKIFLSGGGTMGSVMPLLALWERLRGDFDCIWVGSRKGMERPYIGGLGIKYTAITSAKFRRYFDLRTLPAPLFVFLAILESSYLLIRFRPRAVVVSGSFISVPLVWAAWMLGVRRIVHQEDLKIGLAGWATIPFASAVTVAFPETAEAIKQKIKKSKKQNNVFLIGNPVREMFKNPKIEKWRGDLPLILVLGGGLGSQKINQAIKKIAPELVGQTRILHLTGKNKTVGLPTPYTGYEKVEGLWGEELAGAMAAADIVVSRAGLSTLGELSVLGKPAILVPLPGVGQEDNAEYFAERGAAVVAPQDDPAGLLEKIKSLLQDKEKRKMLGESIKKIFPPDAAGKLADITKKLSRLSG